MVFLWLAGGQGRVGGGHPAVLRDAGGMERLRVACGARWGRAAVEVWSVETIKCWQKTKGKSQFSDFLWFTTWFCVDLVSGKDPRRYLSSLFDFFPLYRIRVMTVGAIRHRKQEPPARSVSTKRPGSGAGWDELNQQIYRDYHGDIKYI